ncbi:ervatamin-B-like [Rhinatrema bivittatum]|uniref:ervatamin-B-like n=1 Tax=Rhinatrema bivittatum TaxID=194408 RepID=UPI001127E18B|nr:ervatamin-B-like [Rhinatrema bivittatum]
MDKVNALLLLAWIVGCSAMSSEFLEDEWKMWKNKYEKNYATLEEETHRRENWEATRKKVLEHNQLADQGKKKFRLTMNHFADMSSEDRNSRNCLLPIESRKTKARSYRRKTSLNIPDEVDWRKEKCVTPVRNQGAYCGSCWAFATVAVLESRYCIKYKELIKLSEQQLLDCDRVDEACCGGLPRNAFRYISDHGIMKRNEYEYEERANACQYEKNEILKMNISKYYVLPDEENMAMSVAFDGPVTVAIGSHEEFQLFDGKGIYDGECTEKVNHAIVIVGYGTEEGTDYWIIRNSWGESWADGGYAKVPRNVNKCLIGEEAATADILGPKEVPNW